MDVKRWVVASILCGLLTGLEGCAGSRSVFRTQSPEGEPEAVGAPAPARPTSLLARLRAPRRGRETQAAPPPAAPGRASRLGEGLSTVRRAPAAIATRAHQAADSESDWFGSDSGPQLNPLRWRSSRTDRD